jgi:hypothetical protein
MSSPENGEAVEKLFEKREVVEQGISTFIAKSLFKTSDLTVNENYEVQAQTFEHIKQWERIRPSGLHTDLMILLMDYCELTSQIYRLRA